jgi:hypothetical protein
MFMAFADIRGKNCYRLQSCNNLRSVLELLSRFILNNLDLISIVDNSVIKNVG